MKVQPNVLRLQLCLSKKCHWSKAYSVQQLCVHKVSIWFQHFDLLLYPIISYLTFSYLFVWRGFMEANTYHPILNISVVPRRYFSFTDLMFTVHSTITIIGSIDTYINVAKMSRKALYRIALPPLSSTYYFQEPSSCRISSTPTARARFPSEAGCLSLSANNLKQTYFEQFD